MASDPLSLSQSLFSIYSPPKVLAQNCDTNRIKSVTPLCGEQHSYVSRYNFDGTEVELSGPALEDLALAFAITVHKAHGSSFRKVVIPIQKEAAVGRSFVYTAITRATDLAVWPAVARC